MPHPAEEPGDREARMVLPDLMGVPLTDLLRSENSALARAVKRAIVEVDRSGESYAAFGNAP